MNHWYRWTTLFNLDTNRVVEVAITDLDTGSTSRQPVANRYLFGGVAGSTPPDGFRLFAGTSSVAGNVMAWDNVVVARPEALLLQDKNPWYNVEMLKALAQRGVAYDMASSADIGARASGVQHDDSTPARPASGSGSVRARGAGAVLGAGAVVVAIAPACLRY